MEQCGLTLAHQFPWAASSYVAVGLALRRRLLAPDTPSTAAKRKQISKVGRRPPCFAADQVADAHQRDVFAHCITLFWGCACLGYKQGILLSARCLSCAPVIGLPLVNLELQAVTHK